MALYDYYCLACDRKSEDNVPIEDRDNPQPCECGNNRWRVMTFNGAVWAPSAKNGGLAR